MQSDEERTMVMEKNKVKLTICGAEYIIGSDEDSKYMIELGDEVDEKYPRFSSRILAFR